MLVIKWVLGHFCSYVPDMQLRIHRPDQNYVRVTTRMNASVLIMNKWWCRHPQFCLNLYLHNSLCLQSPTIVASDAHKQLTRIVNQACNSRLCRQLFSVLFGHVK